MYFSIEEKTEEEMISGDWSAGVGACELWMEVEEMETGGGWKGWEPRTGKQG